MQRCAHPSPHHRLVLREPPAHSPPLHTPFRQSSRLHFFYFLSFQIRITGYQYHTTSYPPSPSPSSSPFDLRSNRCIALYNLKKIGKALADAEKACELRPDWEKAHYRRGLCFEEQEKYEDALAAYMTSLELEKNKECAEKVKNIKKLLSKGVKDEPRPDGVKTVEEYRTIQGQLSRYESPIERCIVTILL